MQDWIEHLDSHGDGYLFFSGDATVSDVLNSYREHEAQWWWLLVVQQEDGGYGVCSFGSLLPYLVGRTPHIVHNIGDCAVCSAMDPVLWRDTDDIITQVEGDRELCSRSVSGLPLASLPVAETSEVDVEGAMFWGWVSRRGWRVCGFTEQGVLIGVYVARMRSLSPGPPEF